jgi:hypothetical protein
MKLPSRKTVLANLLCLGAIAWIYGGDLADALRARDAEVAAFTALPSPVRPAGVLALGVLAAGVALWGLARGREEGFKGYRLLPILLVGALFVDLVAAENRVPLDSTDLASGALLRFHQLTQELVSESAVPDDPRVLQPLLEQLGRPPYLERGAPLEAYTLQVRKECEGPVREAPGVRPGTLLYCVAPERKGAWVTLVGLPAGERFGAPAMLSARGEVRFVLVQPVGAEQEPEAFRERQAPPEPASGPDAGTSSVQP